jgi:hydrogenase maturation protein HypF
MTKDMAAAERLVEIDAEAAALLTGPLRPIVLLPRRDDANVADGVADGLPTLGVTLPYTPVHHLLFDALVAAGVEGPLVATSGNVSDEPLVKDNEAAIAHLGSMADALLVHNRDIERRVDDSVVQLSGDGMLSILRRARGYAPQPVRLDVSDDAPAILAVGSELKNAVCLFARGRAAVSEHIGDLKDGRTYRHFIDTVNHLEQLFDVRPEALAADLHPQYLSTEYALRRHRGELAGREALPIVRVQHHHAHIVSCMAEHGRREAVIGLACDGVGYGDDGAVWGCEILQADWAGYERLGHLRYLPLVGGDAAAVESWRVAVAALHETFGDGALAWARTLALSADAGALEQAMEMLTLGVSCPPASSLGRWFDAVAALAGVAGGNRYEGEAPMRLEGAIDPKVDEAYAFALESTGPFAIDLRPMVEQIVADVMGGQGPGVVAAKFHNTVAAFLQAAAERAREQTGIETVALSGGCFANRYLTARLNESLSAAGFEVLRHRTIPCNDGGVALGQAVVAAAQRSGRPAEKNAQEHE